MRLRDYTCPCFEEAYGSSGSSWHDVVTSAERGIPFEGGMGGRYPIMMRLALATISSTCESFQSDRSGPLSLRNPRRNDAVERENTS